MIDNTKESNRKEHCFYKIGKSYFIRTVTMHFTGRLIDFTDKELILEDAAWIADSGRFHTALKNGDFSEIEPYVTNILVNRESIIDASEWNHKLPINQK